MYNRCLFLILLVVLIPLSNLAYAAPGDIDDTVIESGTYNPTLSVDPDIINVSGDIFAVVYRTSNLGVVRTINIDSSGDIGSTVDTLTFDSSNTAGQTIVSVSGEVYAVAYRQGSTNDVELATFTIDSSGNISDSVTDTQTVESNTGQGDRLGLIKVADNMVAIAYPEAGTNDGFVDTYQINSDGTIENSATDTQEFDDSQGLDPRIINVSGNVYAIGFQDTSADLTVTTVTITSAGAIGDSIVDTLPIETGQGVNPTLTNVAGNIFAVAYNDVTNTDVEVATITIDSAGNIDDDIIEIQVLDSDSIPSQTDPEIISLSGGVFAVAYAGADSGSDGAGDGFVVTFEIDSSGDIAETLTDTLEFDTTRGLEPDIVNVSGDVFAIPYREASNNGAIVTISIERPPTPSGAPPSGGHTCKDCKPPSFTIGFTPDEYPLSINGVNFTLPHQSNHINTTTIKTGEPAKLKLLFYENKGPHNIPHIALYTDFKDNPDPQFSDTNIVLDNNQVTSHDPNQNMLNYTVNVQEIDDKLEVTFDIIFAKPIGENDIIIRAWDSKRNALDSIIYQAVNVVGEEVKEEKEVIQFLMVEPKEIEEFVESKEKLVILDEWAGYYAETASNEKVLETLGFDGEYIPHWVKKAFGEGIHNGKLTIDELTIALDYLSKIDVVN